jgi:lycopene beta-cyclase
MMDWIAEQPNVTFVRGDVTDVAQDRDAARLTTRDGRVLRGRWVFNSLQLSPPQRSAGHHFLLQHFLGWVIRAPDPLFDPSVATLMDFRVEQGGDTRFVYVMPFDAHTALVEYTVFSPQVLPRADYVAALKRYIQEHLRIDRYDAQHEEFGVIPMTDLPYPVRPSANVFNIGTAGGRTKPSTGYTFKRIQTHSAEIAAALKTTGSPVVTAPLPNRRYELFDSTLLNVLERGRDSGKQVFSDLFARNPPQRVFRFLDEETTLAEDIQIMTSVNMPAFVAATADAVRRRM